MLDFHVRAVPSDVMPEGQRYKLGSTIFVSRQEYDALLKNTASNKDNGSVFIMGSDLERLCLREQDSAHALNELLDIPLTPPSSGIPKYVITSDTKPSAALNIGYSRSDMAIPMEYWEPRDISGTQGTQARPVSVEMLTLDAVEKAIEQLLNRGPNGW